MSLALCLAAAPWTAARAAAPPSETVPPSAAEARGAARVVAPRFEPGSFEAGQHPASAAGLGLQRLDDGRYSYADPARRFVAQIELDGTVNFADRWRRVDARTGGRRSERGRAGGVPAEGMLRATAPFSGAQVSGPTEWALRARGHDPTASAKAAWLRRSESFRARLALAWHRELLRARVATLPARLEALWSDTSRPAEQRRALLFAQWDECDEPVAVAVATRATTGTLARDRRRAAAVARAVIERFVRSELPPGSPDAYPPAQLHALNADRLSEQQFDPYPATTSGG
jgi:hypothetical protein